MEGGQPWLAGKQLAHQPDKSLVQVSEDVLHLHCCCIQTF
jgi:hypothetical protein